MDIEEFHSFENGMTLIAMLLAHCSQLYINHGYPLVNAVSIVMAAMIEGSILILIVVGFYLLVIEKRELVRQRRDKNAATPK